MKLEEKLNKIIEEGYIDENEFQEYEALIFFEAGEKLALAENKDLGIK